MLITTLLAQIAFGLIAMIICLHFSYSVVAFGLFQLVYVPLSDRYGRKGVLIRRLALIDPDTHLAPRRQQCQVLAPQ